jgi:hypothetical protein
MILSSSHLFFGNFASAATGAANFLPNRVMGADTPNEQTLSLSTAQYITNCLNSRYPSNWVYPSYGYSCTTNSYMSILNTLQTYDKAVVFTKGHRGIPSSGHISLFSNDSVVIDYDIYTRTSAKNAVTFIWHCQTALYYTTGASHYDSQKLPYGMPYCFTHNNNMVKYGASGSQVYLGWTDNVPGYPYPQQLGGSPQYEYPINILQGYNYAQVAALFWYYMSLGYSTTAALNQVTYTLYGTTFSMTALNNWLVVYGNGNLGLP